MNELDPGRLREIVARLTEAQQEALEVVGRALEPVDFLDEVEQMEVSERLEAALEDVLAILEGAQEDVRALSKGEA